ncbi:lactonase family protein [Rugamonas apoptosis]|uniref:Lactonase family protein n=1 Tax=Rugamonas apoptosis TaxID=2758570 RepID=A0A7W2FF97_9BURK|nr:lactonase family protein [Rugamonas apoptosis]MBA5690658.1 lactonase family protein [Rugamonas apoptosis]
MNQYSSSGPRRRLLASCTLAVLAAGTGWPTSAANATTTYAYVGSRTTKERNARGEGLSVFHVDATGIWTQVQLIKNLVNPSFITLDRKQRRLYVVHGDHSEVSAFAIDPFSGKLTFMNRQSTGGKNPVHLAVDPANHFLFVANYATGSIATLPINADGSLASATSLVTLPGEPGPHKVQQTGSHPHQVMFDPSGRYLLVPDKGLDRVFSYSIHPQSGALLPAEVPSVAARSGSGTRHIAFHPRLPYAYVMNELNSSVTTYAWNANEGALTPMQVLPTTPASNIDENTGAGIICSANGKFVYGSNRGHDSVAIYHVNQESGLLEVVGWQPTGGNGPRFITIDPDSQFLYAANENSDTISRFRMNPANGALTPAGEPIATGSPVCIVFARY